MNFDFSDEQKQMRDEARKFLSEQCPPKAVREVLDGKAPYDKALWKGLAEMGFLGVAIPEQFGGAGAGHLELCVIAEEMGRALAPVPFSSTVYLAAEAILLAGSDAQKQKWLPKIAAGEAIGTLALFEGKGNPSPKAIKVTANGGVLNGVKKPVPDGAIADFAVVAARTGSSGRESDISLFIVDLKASGVEIKSLTNIDLTRGQAEFTFKDAKAEPLGAAGEGWSVISQVLDRAAVLTAFEQVGGADRALEMGRDYALDRIAFGRPIGSFQAVKHMLADMYVSATLARSNCYYGAWALSTNAGELPEAAAAARISATQAFQHCAKNNIQVHGGMGFTWEFDCHMYYRRANAVALGLGSPSYWEDALIDRMRKKNAA
ncbi:MULTISPECIES: acyl-CoA dehydrogenase family protein [Bradyrhizobium]|jgi:alkylation response protein AidB-like acyl-CoA dehydrogenase|uniref:acyl-CoA dehydrogenase family protein n=1 Tax=Bradyrhizobium TaxID=374 RepID=UPI00047FEBBC|nr:MULTISPECIES: acyl-CoA dehydrogenase family protein [Bradyrhizobium]MCS3445611.1 alkylation response protein AidB-like acyl-CoA dehydrogenase [Bradyrhizobium elkanii]MCS3563258.1 alkylation response protein AidB-like acyl-CoA dehydrogenase [Bradyrhizobium elkanii]MCW2146907.1 alkylation response protein AidB-like acyl-CoA dehydrogenase [Bradyrhizobium elkanii]MCW2354017.1 alkylation response protein AidB-like acyl-CoA dehydrogenase [Bradyrhizobium elkanii]MCW2379737.1 alkylation response pr